ncbi:MAG: hypothetical protein J0I09_05930 [Sphingobacteriia bacterium]|nr:hypothetical protein [Sphingobacteriia bacterium]
MRRIYFLCIALISISVVTLSCGKGASGGGSSTTEATLAVTLNPAAGSNLPAQALGSGLPLTVTVTSTMPSNGVRIDVAATNQTSNVTFFSTTVSNANAANNFTITNIPTGSVSCKCTVTVTSLSSSSNVWTGSFIFAAK